MLQKRPRLAMLLVIIAVLSFSSITPFANAKSLPQQPTVMLPTVTSSPSGPIVTVRSDQEEYVNVRSGPGLFFPKVGVLLKGQQAPAKGRSAGGDWILIEYPGIQGGTAWVYAHFVNLTPGSLPIIEPPPTPTPELTATIDPTLAAQFIVTSEPTRLPTFTEAAPITIPTFVESSVTTAPGGIPYGLIIIVVGLMGTLLGLFSFTQMR